MAINKKCAPGVVCIENMTLFFILFIVIIFIYIFINQQSFNKNHYHQQHEQHQQQHHQQQQLQPIPYPPIPSLIPKPNYSYSNLPGDVLLNPYVPPLKDDRYFTNDVVFLPPGRIPINISTNVGAVDTNYRQVGILTPLNHNLNGKILPLLGRPLFTSRDKWQYYSMSDQNNSIKLPLRKNGKNCTNEYGCDSFSSGDNVFVEGYKQAFKVTMYESDTIKYLPFL